VKNESYQIFTNISKPNVAYFTSTYSSKYWLKMIAKKTVVPNYLYWLKVTKTLNMEVTNLCKQIFVTFGRIGAWSHSSTWDWNCFREIDAVNQIGRKCFGKRTKMFQMSPKIYPTWRKLWPIMIHTYTYVF
jgi:hypothetical protein